MLLGVERADPEPDGAVDLVGPHLFVDKRRAVESGPAGDAEVHVQHRPRVGRVHPLDVEGQNCDMVLEAVQAVENDAGDNPEAVEEYSGEPHFLGVDSLESLAQEPGQAGFEAGDAHDVGSAVFETVRVFVEMGPDGRAHARASGPGVPDLDAFTDVESADARRAEQGLVAGEGHDIEKLGVHVDGHLARRLGRIDGEGDARLPAELADRGDGLDRADDVRSVVDDDQARVGPEPLADFLRIDEAGRVERHEVDCHPFPGEMVERSKDGIVFDGRRDGVVAGTEHAEDDQVQSVCRVVAEAEAVGVRAVEELGQHLTGLFDDQPGLHAQIVAGPSGVDAVIAEEIIHVCVDFFGLGKGGRPVVEEDQLAHVRAPYPFIPAGCCGKDNTKQRYSELQPWTAFV